MERSIELPRSHCMIVLRFDFANKKINPETVIFSYRKSTSLSVDKTAGVNPDS